MKMFKRIYYRIKIGVLFYNENQSTVLSNAIIDLLKTELIQVQLGEYRAFLKFKDNIDLQFWNANKYYAWAQEGRIIKDGKVAYSWISERPSSEAIYKLKQAIEKKGIL